MNLRINRETLQILFSDQTFVMCLNAIIEKIIFLLTLYRDNSLHSLTLAVSCVLSLRKGRHLSEKKD